MSNYLTPKTKEEKRWFFYGYFIAQADNFAKEFGYTREEASEMLLREWSYKKKSLNSELYGEMEW